MASSLGASESKPSRFKYAFFISSLALAGLLAGLARLAAESQTPLWRLVVLAVAAHSAWGACLFFAWKFKGLVLPIRAAIALCALMRLILVPAPPVFSDDVYRYVWDGRVLLSGTNPYRFAPDDVNLEHLRDQHWNRINNKPLRTIYPPLAEVFFGATAFFCPSPIGFKAASALADIGVVCVVILLAGGRLRERGGAIDPKNARDSLLIGLAYGLNPLACIETGMSGHLDSLAILAMLLALYLMKKEKHLAFGALIGLGAGVKLAPALALPASRKKATALLAFSITAIAVYLPFASAGIGTIETLDAFARRWEGNGGLFPVVDRLADFLIRAISGAEGANPMVHVKCLDGIAAQLQGTFFSLHKDGGFDPAAPGAFALNDLSLAAAKISLGVFVVFTILFVSVKRLEPLSATAWIFASLIVATPVLHPWYLLWIVPLAAILGQWPWMILAALSPLSYLPLELWRKERIWSAPIWIQLVEWGAFACAAAIFFFTASNRRKKNSP